MTNLHAQPPVITTECATSADLTPPPFYAPPGSNCTKSDPIYSSFFRLQQNFKVENGITTPETVTKELKVRFVFVENRTGKGVVKTNFRSNDASYINLMVDWLNQFFSITDTPTNPVDTICGLCHIEDSRIRVKLHDFYFYNDTTYTYYSTSHDNRKDRPSDKTKLPNPDAPYVKSIEAAVGDSLKPYRNDSLLTIFFYVDSSSYISSNATFGTGGVSYGLGYKFLGQINDYQPYILMKNVFASPWYSGGFKADTIFRDNLWRVTTTLFHEICHSLGLGHLNPNDDQGRRPNGDSRDFLEDAIPDFADSIPKNDKVTNNVMNKGYTPHFGLYISPLQIGRMHRDAYIGLVNKCMYPTEDPETHPWEITSDQTWNFAIRMYQNIIVKEGNTLTISCRVQMPPKSKIIVEKNAKLIIDGGEVTSYSPKHRWSGIELHGDTSKAPDPLFQGSLVMNNNAEISYADKGIRNYIDNIYWGGGIISVQNSTIRNCWRAVGLNYYPRSYIYNNESQCKFDNVQFIYDDPIVFEGHGPQNFQVFSSYYTKKGVEITNSLFENTLESIIQPQKERGIAVYIISTGMKIKGTQFKGFKKGVYATGHDRHPNQLIKIHNNNFKGITENITLSNSPFGDIRGNVITNLYAYPTPGIDQGYQYPYGIYLDRPSTNIVKCQNFVYGGKKNYPDNMVFGIIVNASNAMGATIKENTFNNLHIGTQMQRNNQELNVLCNQYDDYDYAWYVNPEPTPVGGSSRYRFKDQGTGCGPQEYRAGNLFHSNLGIRLNLGYTGDWTYYWWENDDNQDPLTSTNNKHEPCDDGNGTPIDPNSICQHPYSINYSCSSSSEISLQDLKDDYDDVKIGNGGEGGGGSVADPIGGELFTLIVQDYSERDDMDGLILFLEEEAHDLARRYLIPIYLEKEQYLNMENTINDLSIDTEEKQGYSDYYGILADLKQNNKGLHELSNSQYNQIETLADSEYEVSGLAKGLLEGVYGIEWMHPIEMPEVEAAAYQPWDIKDGNDKIILSPNPAGNKVYIQVNLSDEEKQDFNSYRIVIRNMMGVEIFNTPYQYGGIEANTQSWVSGLYFVILERNGAVINSQKLSIQH